MNTAEFPEEPLRTDLMTTSPNSVRASATKLSEERLRQARNRGLPAKGDRYSTRGLLTREEYQKAIVCKNTGKLKIRSQTPNLDILDMVFHPWIPGKGRDPGGSAYG
jgi:hypothetical protein